MTGGTESVTLATEGDRYQEQQDRESPQDLGGRDAEGTTYQQPENQTRAKENQECARAGSVNADITEGKKINPRRKAFQPELQTNQPELQGFQPVQQGY